MLVNKYIPVIIIMIISAINCSISDTYEKEINFKSGNFTINGSLLSPTRTKNKKLKAFILIHDAGEQDRNQTVKIGSVTLKPFRDLSEFLAQQNSFILRYDKRNYTVKKKNLPKSFNSTPENFINDAIAAYDYLASHKNVDKDRISIIGHGQGGSFATYVAEKRKVHKIYMIAPDILPITKGLPSRLENQIKFFKKNPRIIGSKKLIKKLAKIQNKYTKAMKMINNFYIPDNKLILGMSKYFWKKWLMLSRNFDQRILKINKPIIILQGTKDLFCPAEIINSKEKIYKKNPYITIRYIKNMRHDMHSYKSGTFMTEVVDIILEKN